MGQIAKALGMAGSVEFQGKTWTIAPFDTAGIQGRFEEWCESYAYAKAKRKVPYKTEAERIAGVDKVDRDINSGLYTFGGTRCGEMMEIAEGRQQLVHLLIHENHKDFTADMAKELSMDGDKMQEMFRHINGVMDPNAKPPASPGNE